MYFQQEEIQTPPALDRMMIDISPPVGCSSSSSSNVYMYLFIYVFIYIYLYIYIITMMIIQYRVLLSSGHNNNTISFTT